MYADDPLKLHSYWTKVKVHHILTRCSQITPLNLVKSELLYSDPFQNTKATNEGEYANFADFDPKIGCHGSVTWAIGKRGSHQ